MRLFAAVATRIPKNPANPLQSAPTTKDTATKLVPCEALPQASKTATAITKIDKTLYSRARNAIAPSRTACPIACIFSFPGSCLLIHLDLINA